VDKQLMVWRAATLTWWEWDPVCRETFWAVCAGKWMSVAVASLSSGRLTIPPTKSFDSQSKMDVNGIDIFRIGHFSLIILNPNYTLTLFWINAKSPLSPVRS
jgi:hypothetical protein